MSVEGVKMPEAPRLSEQLCFAAYAASHAFGRAYRQVLDPLGLTYPQFLVLLVLWEDGDVAVNHIGRRLYLDSGTLTPVLKRMEAADLIRRRRSVEDERRVLVSVTAKGQAMREPVAGVCGRLSSTLDLSSEKVDALRADLMTIVGSLEHG